ncbi:MAG: hypothetical protein EXS05_09715 [Planctomycetaceae bacterium]|nr:hypothetical protein [Planctomycetaceae bacterium]
MLDVNRQADMTYKGTVHEGVVVLDVSVSLPEGTAVVVSLAEPDDRTPALNEVYRIAELAVSTGIPDLALNVDHHLYGHPKAADGGS